MSWPEPGQQLPKHHDQKISQRLIYEQIGENHASRSLCESFSIIRIIFHKRSKEKAKTLRPNRRSCRAALALTSLLVLRAWTSTILAGRLRQTHSYP